MEPRTSINSTSLFLVFKNPLSSLGEKGKDFHLFKSKLLLSFLYQRNKPWVSYIIQFNDETLKFTIIDGVNHKISLLHILRQFLSICFSMSKSYLSSSGAAAIEALMYFLGIVQILISIFHIRLNITSYSSQVYQVELT